jgi:uncharacterized protein
VAYALAMLRLRLLCLLVTLATACAHGSAAKTSSASPNQPVSPSIFLWHATRAGKPGEVWLLGSVHLRESDRAALDQAVVEQVTRCERAAFELDFDTLDMAQMSAYMQREGALPAGQTLKDVVAPETWAKVSGLLGQLKLGEGVIERLRPWTASLVLQLAYYEQKGMGGEQGVDRAVQTLARREPSRSRQIIGLETALEQLEILRGSMADSQEAMLLSTAEDIASGESERVLELYEAGDERNLESMIVQSRAEAPQLEPFMREVLDGRNERMAAKLLPDFDKPGCTFVTVGAAHLFGPKGLRRLFEESGAHVVSVPGKGPASPELQALSLPASGPFVSEQEGFSVDLGGQVMRQEIDVPGGKARVFMVAEGARAMQSVTVMDLPAGLPPELHATMLQQALAGGLLNAQLTPQPPVDIVLGGAPGMRIDGKGAEGGPIGTGHAAGVIHGSKLVIVMAMAMQRDAANYAQVATTFDTILRTFSWLPPRP